MSRRKILIGMRPMCRFQLLKDIVQLSYELKYRKIALNFVIYLYKIW